MIEITMLMMLMLMLRPIREERCGGGNFAGAATLKTTATSLKKIR